MAIFDGIADEVQKTVKQMLSGSGEIRKAVEGVAHDMVDRATQAQKRQMEAVDKTIAQYGRVYETMKKDAEASGKVLQEATRKLAEQTEAGKAVSKAIDNIERSIEAQRKAAEATRDKAEATARQALETAKALADEKTRAQAVKKAVDDIAKYHPAVLARKVEALEKRCAQLEAQLRGMKK